MARRALSFSGIAFWLFAEALFDLLHRIERKLNEVGQQVSIDQDVLDADGQALSQVAADLAQVIANGNLSAADQTTLNNGIQAITNLDTVSVTPPAPPSS